MKLYHGSKNPNLEVIKRHQAQAGEGINVPSDELLDAIYLTPDYGYALAMAARPGGVTYIDNDSKTITFENPEAFDPNEEIYVYEVDIDDEKTREIDPLQTVIESNHEVTPIKVNAHRAGEIENYYRILKEAKEGEDKLPEFKIR